MSPPHAQARLYGRGPDLLFAVNMRACLIVSAPHQQAGPQSYSPSNVAAQLFSGLRPHDSSKGTVKALMRHTSTGLASRGIGRTGC